MNEELFLINLAFLQKLYGKIDKEIIPIYWNILKSKSDEEFKAMVENIAKTFIPTSQVPFPLPAHFLNATGLSGKNRSVLAVNAVKEAINKIGPYRSINFGDKALHETINRFGGWPEMCTWDLEKWEYNEKRFIACYEACLSDGTGPEKLMGICEYENSDKMHLFTERQKEIALSSQKTVNLPWKGFQVLLQKNENKMELEDKNVSEIVDDLVNKFSIKSFS